MKRNNNKGFTLAELLIVVAVIAVLVAVAIPTFTGQLEKSRQGVDLSNLRSAYAAAKLQLLNENDSGSPLKSAKAGATQDVVTYFWYNAKTNSLKWMKNSENKASSLSDDYKPGRAEGTSVIIDVEQLPDEVQYLGTHLTADVTNGYRAGTRDKAIVARFLYTFTTNSWALTNVYFGGDLADESALPETTIKWNTGTAVTLAKTTPTAAPDLAATAVAGNALSLDLTEYFDITFAAPYASQTPTLAFESDKDGENNDIIAIKQNGVDVPTSGIAVSPEGEVSTTAELATGVYTISGIKVSATPTAIAGETAVAHSATFTITLTVS